MANLHRGTMKNTRFVVKVNRGGTRGTEYVQRIDRKPVETTLLLNLALVMGKFTAEDVVTSLGKSRWSPELLAV
jgi:hypothetical protein